jgi:competence protein ComEA
MVMKLIAALAALTALEAFATVDANKATRAELESVTGLGTATVSMILDERGKGPFKDWADLIARVKGVGEGNAARLSVEGMTVDNAPYKGVAAKTSAKGKRGSSADKPSSAKAGELPSGK